MMYLAVQQLQCFHCSSPILPISCSVICRFLFFNPLALQLLKKKTFSKQSMTDLDFSDFSLG